jgi:uncharacterized protein YbaP (TraB family)
MKLKFFSVFVFVSLFSFSQENQNSLLWEISGNGLEKPSYLYGTMHVSNKVAFRLDDVFFEALNKADYVALESSPSEWLAYNYYTTTLFPQNYASTFEDDFYSNIVGIEAPKDLLIRSAIRFNNQLVNGILYRKDSAKDNFEEETYLDMFIYQAGKKTDKPIISLEDLEESRYLVEKAQKNTRKDKIDPWLAKIYEKENAYLLRENTYRDRNIQFLDSISKASNSEYFREHMLFIRNDNMVKVLDSVMKTKSVFSGVGAAHLGGKLGMIQLLQNLGYQVKPLTSLKTNLAISEKERLETKIKTPTFSPQQTPDGFIRLNAYGELREFLYNGIKYYISPDLPNGAHLTITRINTFNYLPNDNNLYLDNIEKYLFEDVPGKIISKEPISGDYPGLSIINQTKKGDYEKFHIYQTPLEFIIIKLSGLKNYVLNFQNEVFNSISFKNEANSIETLNEPYHKYEVKFPNTYVSDNYNYSGNKLVQAKYNDAFYFLRETVYHDNYYLEEDSFEAKYMAHTFLKNLELDVEEGKLTKSPFTSYETAVKLKDSTNQFFIKTIIKDGSYYTLGYVGKDEVAAKNYFNSIKFKAHQYPDNFEKIIDTSLHFSVRTNTKTIPPKGKYSYEKEKPYEEKESLTTYYSKANEQIYVTKYKYHDLQMFEHIDSLWSTVKQEYKNYSQYDGYKDFILLNEEKQIKDSTYTYEYTLRDSASAKQIYVKHLLKKGAYFELRSQGDTVTPKSHFVKEFYNSFTPLDTLLGVSIFKDKTQVFLNALKANDSIVFGSVDKLKFSASHAVTLMQFLKTFNFPENKKDIKYKLIKELAALEHPELEKYLEQLYDDSYSDPEVQITILNSFFRKNTSKSYKQFIELLNKDLPLDEREIKNVLNRYNDSLSGKKQLFPELLQFTSVNDYKAPIYGLLSQLIIKDEIKPKVYKKYKKQIINDGKIEIKRSLSQYTSSYKGNYDLIDYVYLIFPYREEKMAQDFFNKLIESKNGHAQASYYSLLARENETISDALKQKTIYNDDVKHLIISKLYHKELFNQAKATGITQDSYIKSYLFADTNIEKERDSIVFVDKKQFVTDLDQKGEIHFYKLIKTTSDEENIRLYYFAYLKDESNDLISLDSYLETGSYGEEFNENKDEEELYQNIIDKVVHKTRKRLFDEDY